MLSPIRHPNTSEKPNPIAFAMLTKISVLGATPSFSASRRTYANDQSLRCIDGNADFIAFAWTYIRRAPRAPRKIIRSFNSDIAACQNRLIRTPTTPPISIAITSIFRITEVEYLNSPMVYQPAASGRTKTLFRSSVSHATGTISRLTSVYSGRIWRMVTTLPSFICPPNCWSIFPPG